MDLSHVLLIVSLGLCILGRKTTEVQCPSHHLIKSTCHQRDLSPMMLTLVIWLRQCLSGFSVVKLLLPPILCFWGESRYAQPTLRPWGVMLHLLEGAFICIHCLGRFCTGDSSILPLFIQSFIWGWTHGYIFYTLGYILFYFIYLFNLFLAALGFHCCAWAFSSCIERGATLCCGAWASHCGGFSCCGARALGAWASVVVARRL